MKTLYVYIMANKRNGTLYVGVTNDLMRRVYEHKQDVIEGFSKKYETHRLVYFEFVDDPESAIRREKQLKNWHRNWKKDLIENANPSWRDLYEDWVAEKTLDSGSSPE